MRSLLPRIKNMTLEYFPALASDRLAADIVGDYFDSSSGCRFVVARPEDQAELWLAYLAGAQTNYRRHGVESVLEYDRIVDGSSTALFVVALESDGRVVGGMRMQGRYQRAEQTHALEEWAGRTGTAELVQEINDRLPDGIIEMKSGWVSDDALRREAVTAALARIFTHSFALMDVRYVMGTVAVHAVKRWQTTGGVISSDVAPVAYPDDRYQTVVMWWDRKTFADLAVAAQLPFIIDECAQLAESRGLIAARLVSVSP